MSTNFQITSGVTAERRADKVNYLLQNQDRDPNLAVLRNYFRKMKTLPQTVQKRPDTVKSETTVEGYNPFAGFGPIVSQHSRHKKSNKIARKKNRSRRKIFLTVNEAFSESDHGRELRPRNINYLVFVPAPDTEQPPPSPGQQVLAASSGDHDNILLWSSFMILTVSHSTLSANNKKMITLLQKKFLSGLIYFWAHNDIMDTHLLKCFFWRKPPSLNDMLWAFYSLLWISGKGQARMGKWWPPRRKASKLKPFTVLLNREKKTSTPKINPNNSVLLLYIDI